MDPKSKHEISMLSPGFGVANDLHNLAIRVRFSSKWAIRFGSESGKQGSGSQPDNKLARKSTKEITFLKVDD